MSINEYHPAINASVGLTYSVVCILIYIYSLAG